MLKGSKFTVVEAHGVPVGVGVETSPGNYHMVCNLILPEKPSREELEEAANNGRMIADALTHFMR